MVTMFLLTLELEPCSGSLAVYTGGWTGWGGSYLNNRWVSSAKVSSSSIHSLSEHCKITYPVGVSAPPAILDGVAYYSTWNGSFVALDYKACSVKWQINVTGAVIDNFGALSAAQLATTVPIARTSPQIDEKNEIVYFGTQAWALVVAADLKSGKVLGVRQINSHPMATITMSPTLYNGTLFVGCSSGEENAAYLLNNNQTQYPCCSFIGNFVALTFDRSAGKFITHWDTPMIPPDAPTNGTEGKWSGIGVWGSQPAIDTQRHQVFIATGNVYTAPDAFEPCTDSPMSIDACVPPTIWQEAVLALDITTGKPNWVRRLSPLDSWTLVCGVPGSIPRDPALCPHEPGPDADFGMAPAFVPGTGGKKDVVTVGQKNGNLYSLDAATGAIEWASVTSPGGAGGGLMWGVAVDEARVYFSAINYPNLPWTLVPSNVSTNGSGFGAAGLANGRVVWSIAAPAGTMTQVPPTVVRDLVLVGWSGPPPAGVPPVSSGPGGILALNRETGAEVMRYPLDGPFYGGVAVQDEFLFAGTGYKGATGEGHFYVFAVKN
ncbi:quinon protein alcohol dehydrogenase-like superfamily [Echria macrotheca]|uniref:Quinon protein alcohol dehydrogenase-like superfamily n=1 Tax=Echria macrotheca TaxID=438768 RepID=A0AAJ0BH12_9PEZI|nr:quinon protein alcohol dehydrogenase-like superfamily [Echria macrotheca]